MSFENFETLSELEEITEITYYHRYKDRTNVDYFNFLLSTASYLGINFIMSKRMIEFYFKLTQIIKPEDDNMDTYNRYKRLLGAYPIAIKQITYYSEEKSKYFNIQLQDFYDNNKFQYTRQFSRIFGLYVENTKFLEDNKKILSKEQGKNLSLYDVKKEIINNLEMYIKQEDSFGKKYDTSNIKVENFFVNINQNIKNPKLIDILNNYQEAELESYETELYKGAHIKKDICFKDRINIKHIEHKDPYNIWCNFLKDDKTYVRLTDINLHPFCVIVIEHKGLEKLSESAVLLIHLKISRRILAKQNEIINIFKENEFISSIKNNYENKKLNDLELEKSQQRQKDYEKIISNINHSTFSEVKIYSRLDDLVESYERKDIDFKNMLKNLKSIKDFSIIIEYVASLGKYYDEDVKVNKVQEYGIENIFFINQSKSDFYQKIINFLDIKDMLPLIKNKYRIFNVDTNICNFSKIKIEQDAMNLIFFEFILNALKQGNSNLDMKVYYENEKIIIENKKYTKVSGIDNTPESYGVGHKAIRNILKADDIIMDIIEDNPDYYRIELKKEEVNGKVE